MIITRDPFKEHIGNGGSFIGNMNVTRIRLDGVLQESFSVISASDTEGFVDVIQRTSDGHPVIDNTGDYDLPLVTRLTGDVEINWPQQTCSGCVEKTRLSRQRKAWWLY